MISQLTLIRHAIADDRLTTIYPDFERPLTPKGRKEALKNFEMCYHELKTIDLIYCSTATRARQTCNLLTSVVDFNPDRIVYDQDIYDLSGGYETLLGIIESAPDSKHHIALIGHNGSISALASYLAGEDIHMKKGSILVTQVPTAHPST